MREECGLARVKAAGMAAAFTVVPREWELRLLKAERIGTYHLAHELLYRHWHGRRAAHHRLRDLGKSVRASGPDPSREHSPSLSKWG